MLPELAPTTEILGALELAAKCGVVCSEGFPLIDKELMAHLHHSRDIG